MFYLWRFFLFCTTWVVAFVVVTVLHIFVDIVVSCRIHIFLYFLYIRLMHRHGGYCVWLVK
jgi:hypothetical protein